MNLTKLGLLTFLTLLTSQFAIAATKPSVSLLSKPIKTTAETQQILNYFKTTKDPNTIFITGASLVKNTPSKTQENTLLNIVLRGDNPLRQTFAAIILVSMGVKYDELTPILQDALASSDRALRAYTSAAYILLTNSSVNIEDLVHLYIFDANFAQKAMDNLATDQKQLLKLLKNTSKSQDAEVRSATALWLSSLHSQEATNILLKMAKSEKDQQVSTTIATTLAKNFEFSLEGVVTGLKTSYTSPISNTYALALGFMTGNGVNTIKTNLQSKKINIRINAARAVAYMANILSSNDTFEYSSDRNFDAMLLKSLIPQLMLLKNSTNKDEQFYAQNALTQLEKLIN